jgi:hypothetical protein
MRLLIAFLSSAASLLAALAFTTLTVTRSTIVDEDTYLYEEGKLTVDGCTPTWSYEQPYFPHEGPAPSEVTAVSGMPVYAMEAWTAAQAEDAATLSNYGLAPQALAMVGGKISFISWIASASKASGKAITGAHLLNMYFRATIPQSGSNTRCFVISGGPQQVLLRPGGPALGLFHLSGFLANPNFTLYQGTTPLLVNDNWCDTRPAVIVDAATRVGAFPYTANSKDAAMVVILAPGPYTVTITGDAGTSGGSAPPGLRGACRKRRLPVLARRPPTHTATGRNSVFTYAFKSPRP